MIKQLTSRRAPSASKPRERGWEHVMRVALATPSARATATQPRFSASMTGCRLALRVEQLIAPSTA